MKKTITPLPEFNKTITPEEKATQSYFDWSDERVGQFVKSVGKYLMDKKVSGWDKVYTMAATMILIDACQQAQAGELTQTISDYTPDVNDPTIPKTKWKVIIKKLKYKTTTPLPTR